MVNKNFLDTSFIIALINDRDQNHKKARTLSPIYLRCYLVTTDAVLLEVGNALAKDFRNEAVEIIKIMRSSNKTEVIEIDKKLFEKGLALYEKYQDKNWGLVDCLSFVVMKEQDIMDALTFDKDFIQAGFRTVTVES